MFDDWDPFDPAHTAAQIRGVVGIANDPPASILDLGCGSGRVLLPLCQMGYTVVGIDRDPAAIKATEHSLSESGCEATLIAANFRELEHIAHDHDPFDVALCLGNTLMEIVDVDEASDFARAIAQILRSGGSLLIDDAPFEYWEEIANGNWQSGVSDDGLQQIVFEPGDSVFALRTGAAVDTESWEPRPTDRRFRLWSMGDLRLLARIAGLSPPVHMKSNRMIQFAK